MSAANVLRAARRAAGLSQSDLAKRAATSQPAISEFERGAHDPSFYTLDRILRSMGYRVIAVATTRRAAVDAAAGIAEELEQQDAAGAFRILLQFNDDLIAERGANRLALALTVPDTTGRVEWDAALAGITEYRLNNVGIPVPEWVRGVRAAEPTIVSGSKRPAPIHADDVPPELLARNVLIERMTLQTS